MSYTNGLDKPTDYFNTKLYTANNGTLNVTGVGFQPDWVWIKDRDSNTHHNVYDVVRGVQKDLLISSTNAETTSGELTSFDSDGFTVVDSATDRANYLTNNYASWNWLAGGSASSNTDGSITSTVSANTTSGFSIVSYTGNGSAGATVGHGLGVTPKFLIIKKRNDSGYWVVQAPTTTLTSGYLNSSGVISSSANSHFFNNTAMGSSLFTLGSDGYVNTSGGTYIAYCFAEKKGFSKFGSYAGNSSTDGSFIYTGFSPSFVMVKKTDGTGNWVMFDNKRNTFNVVNKRLVANLSDDEGTSDRLDFLSNGWKFRASATNVNGSDSYIYMAFAENPLVTSSGIPTCAR